MKHKTTDLDFLFFKQQCEFWRKALGLHSWKIYYKHESCQDNLADCATNYTGRNATIRLNTNWNMKPEKDELYQTAIHEILEVLLSGLFGQANSRVWDKEEYEREHHAVIRTLEEVLSKMMNPTDRQK